MSQYVFPALDPHQSRARPPTDWEMSLAGAMEAAFMKGAYELDALVAALNGSRVRPREGGHWSAETLTATLRELGA